MARQTQVLTHVRNLENRVLPTLERFSSEIRSEFPNVKVQAFSSTFGQATDTPGQVIALSCALPDAPLNQPDEVVLQVVVGDMLSAQPSVEVDVIWSCPGQLEADLFNGSVPLTERVVDEIEAKLPHLVNVLVEAVRRGAPSTQRA